MEILIFVLIGCLSGTLGGLLGIGGGVLMIPLIHLTQSIPLHEASALSISAVIFTTIGSLIKNHKIINLTKLLPIIISGALSTILFSYLFHVTLSNPLLFKQIFAVSLFLFSLLFFIRFPEQKEPDLPSKGEPFKKVIIGLTAGALPGFLGIGGGVILVPMFHLILRMPIRMAMASSLVGYLLNAIISASIKYLGGHINLYLAIPLAAGTFMGGYMGALLSKKISSQKLKILFITLLIFSSIRMIIS